MDSKSERDVEKTCSLPECIAAAGIGLTSQYLEQFGRKLLGGLLGALLCRG